MTYPGKDEYKGRYFVKKGSSEHKQRTTIKMFKYSRKSYGQGKLWQK